MEARLPSDSAWKVYRDTMHNILVGPAAAVTRSVEKWLRVNDEPALFNYIQWNREDERSRARLGTAMVLVLLM